MNYQIICEQFETQISDLFEELRSGISEREDSRAFGAMIEKKITANWISLCQRMSYDPVATPGRKSIF